MFTLGVMLLGLGLDHFTNFAWQLVLSACTWLILLAACVPLSPEQRSRTAVVILVATVGEIIGSVVWGIYTYRLGNLPMFVPPGHGLVYLTGLRLADTRWAAANRRRFIGVALAGIWTWGLCDTRIGSCTLGCSQLSCWCSALLVVSRRKQPARLMTPSRRWRPVPSTPAR